MRYFFITRSPLNVIFMVILALCGCHIPLHAQVTTAKDTPPFSLRTMGELKLNSSVYVHNGNVAYVDSHTVTMESGQFMHVVISKGSMSFAIALLDPQGRTVLAGSNPDADGPEYVSWIADKPGQYTIHVTPPTLTSGKHVEDYSIELKELREAQTNDPLRVKTLIESYEMMSLWGKLNEQDTAAHADTALALAKDWELLNDTYQFCLSLRVFHSYKPHIPSTDTALRNDIGVCLGNEYPADSRVEDLFESAADAGDAVSRYNLGVWYEQPPRSWEAARESYIKAATQNLPDAIYSLGLLYERGNGVKQDASIAFSLYSKAAALGYAPAQDRAGVFYRFGAGGIPINAKLSSAMLTDAAKQGYVPAEYDLGQLYETGTPPDLTSAKIWYGKAWIHGMYQAKTALARVSEVELGLPGQKVPQEEMTYANNLAILQDMGGSSYKTEPLFSASSSEAAVTTKAPPTNVPVTTASISPSTPNPPISTGPNFALVIGVQNYTGLPRLKTALSDADAVAAELKDHYGFQVKLLRDSTRYQIVSALDEYRRTLPANANLLIYYAGHGHYDAETDRAYWLPVDAERNSTANWLIADEITSDARAIAANHVLIISDSCYSGRLNRAADASMQPTERIAYLSKMIVPRSRTLMSSGGNEPVADEGGNGHSVFADALLTGLKQIEHTTFSARELFQDYVQPRVGGHSEQLPQYDALRNSGDEFGDFIFSRVMLKTK